MKQYARGLTTLAAIMLVIVLGIIGPAQAETMTKDIIYSAANPIPEIAARVRPAVVQVICKEEIWSREFGTEVEETASGSGVYIDSRGYVVTNNHVVEGADLLTVRLLDGTELGVAEVFTDASTDLAVLRLEKPLDAEPVPMGDSDKLVIGELAIAIGNPGALSSTYPGTVTAGIISGLDRENVNAGNFSRAVNVIQMDAAINGGNSGGALLNGRGELIGIPTMKIDMTYYGESIEGLGFAIPVNLVKSVTADLIEYGKVQRPRMGINVASVEGPDDPLPKHPPAGIQILSVEADTPAEKAGLRAYDIITHVNGNRVTTYEQMTSYIDRHQAGDVVTLTVYRCYDPLTNRLMDFAEAESIEMQVELKMLD